jgi:hypothetical protein
MAAPDSVTKKHEARLARMRPNTGHAKVLRAKLGITDAPAAPEPTPVVEKQPKKKKGRAAKKK